MRVSWFLSITLVIFLLVLWNFVDETASDGRRPWPADSGARRAGPGRALPAPSPSDPTARIEIEPCTGTCIGSAFSIAKQGYWLTALHVVDGCTNVWIVTGPETGLPVRHLQPHPRADVSVLQTSHGAPHLALTPSKLSSGQDGFSFGYPQGVPGAVHGRLLGRVQLRAIGRHRFVAPTIAWAEIKRRPERLPQLGGLSGSPMLDQHGAVVGVTIATSPRRGRVISAAPVTLVEAIKQAGLGVQKQGRGERKRPRIESSRFETYGDALRRELSVAQVLCLTKASRRSRRPRQ